MLVDALKKNRSLQKFVRNKMVHIEAKIAENKELRDRIKCILDFQAGCKRRAGKLLSQKKDPHVKLISLPKSRTTKESIKNTVYSGPAENPHVQIYKMVMARFPVALTKQPWSMSDREKLVKGIKQQYQEMMMLDLLELTSDRENALGCLNSLDISSFGDFDVASERFGSFLPLVNWERLASMYFTGRTGAECEARWLNSEDPLINSSPWTGIEEKKLLLICQESGVFDWISIASRLGTRRTPFQCLAHYQRSLNVHIIKRDWTEDDDARLRAAVTIFGQNWQLVASNVEGRTGTQCSNRWRKTLQKRTVGRWSIDEDRRLKVAAILFGAKNWSKMAQFVPGRSQSQCRERWVNCLDPSINLMPWTAEEDSRLNEGIEKFGYCWSEIATHVLHRTDSQCRRRWKVLFPDEVPLLQAARKMQKAALISNFVDRENERPLIGPTDFQSISVNPHACETIEPNKKRRKSSSDALKETLQLNPTESNFADATAASTETSSKGEAVNSDNINTENARKKREVRSKRKCGDGASATVVTDSTQDGERISSSNALRDSVCAMETLEPVRGRHEAVASQTQLCEYATVLRCGKRGRFKLLPKRDKSDQAAENFDRVPLVDPATRGHVNMERGVSDNETARLNGACQTATASSSRARNFKGRKSRNSLQESVDDDMRLCEYVATAKEGIREEKKLRRRNTKRIESTKNHEEASPSEPPGFSEALLADLMATDLGEPPGFATGTFPDWLTANTGSCQDTAIIGSSNADILLCSASASNAIYVGMHDTVPFNEDCVERTMGCNGGVRNGVS